MPQQKQAAHLVPLSMCLISPSSSTGNDVSCIMDILCNANANMPYKLGSELDSISSNIVSGECGNWLLEDDDEECVMS